MDHNDEFCPDCSDVTLDRRDLLRKWSAGAALAAGLPLFATPRVQAAPTPKSPVETAVKALYEMLTDEQKKTVCFDWNHKAPGRGILRTHVSNNWQITKPTIRGEFYTKKQQDLIHDIFKGIISPEWYAKFLKHLKDDTGGQEWGGSQSMAIFGTPGSEQFEFVMTGRHMTIRADGNTTENVAFGGPIFYGHAASGFVEKPGHPGNVFFPQAVMANKVYQMIDPKQQAKALVETQPAEGEVGFKGTKGMFTGIAVAELADEHKKELQKVLTALLEPYRKEDQDDALDCLKKQGGLDKCFLSIYKDSMIDKENWDSWRLEGPSFVWAFRGTPHVHVWVNIADDPKVPLNARG